MLSELTNFFYNQLTNDPKVAAEFAGKPQWLFFQQAPAESDFPHIVHTVDEGEYGEHSQVEGRWFVSVYTAEVTTRQNQTITGLLKRKFSNSYFVGADGLPSIQISLGPSRFVDTGNFKVKRYDIRFDIRYSRSF